MPVAKSLSIAPRHADYTARHKKILDDLSFSIEEGEIHAVLGIEWNWHDSSWVPRNKLTQVRN